MDFSVMLTGTCVRFFAFSFCMDMVKWREMLTFANIKEERNKHE